MQQQNEEYKNWLRQQWELDESARKSGRPPLPRSREERTAIFMESPIWKNHAVRKKSAP